MASMLRLYESYILTWYGLFRLFCGLFLTAQQLSLPEIDLIWFDFRCQNKESPAMRVPGGNSFTRKTASSPTLKRFEPRLKRRLRGKPATIRYYSFTAGSKFFVWSLTIIYLIKLNWNWLTKYVKHMLLGRGRDRGWDRRIVSLKL